MVAGTGSTPVLLGYESSGLFNLPYLLLYHEAIAFLHMHAPLFLEYVPYNSLEAGVGSAPTPLAYETNDLPYLSYPH